MLGTLIPYFLKTFRNSYIGNKVNRIVINNGINAVFASVTGQGFFEIIFRNIQLSELLAKRDRLRGKDVFLANIPIFFLNRDN